ncbi:lytic murein transglycosylase [Martelella mediterranea]|uniref:lytic murein transglycosylase n=1 Tax=Martelella mediterranea TaxID=293089 RepID=UPI001E5269B4|nr:lytic murein transglycosylase [Martelella mediterranea]
MTRSRPFMAVRILCAVFAIALAFLAGAGLSTVANAYDRGTVDRQFSQWLATDMRQAALRSGVSASVYDRVTQGLSINWSLPDLVPPGTKPPAQRKQTQPEFSEPGPYFSENNLNYLAVKGRQLYNQYKPVLDRIEARYGVPGRIVLAIWGREMGYGAAEEKYDILQVLGTKAFMSGSRQQMFQREFIAALQIIQSGAAPLDKRKASWAGAFGQPQLMPSNFMNYAVDFDGDGVIDVWDSVPDSLATIAKHLASDGWERGRDWGYEAVIPDNVSCAQEGPDNARAISAWTKQGITRVNGKAFPADELRKPGMMLVPQGRYGPEFIVTPNFYVLKEYNNSDLYALFVGNLADRIQYGMGAFVQPWQRTGTLLRSDVAAMQRKLEGMGYDVGGADGLVGFKTRRSIGDWQARNRVNQTCWPTPALKNELLR